MLLPNCLPIAVAVENPVLGIIRRRARVPTAKQEGVAIQFAIFIGFVGNTLTARLSAATKMKKFDQFFRLVRNPPEECCV
jgi:hypothetical protein